MNAQQLQPQFDNSNNGNTSLTVPAVIVMQIPQVNNLPNTVLSEQRNDSFKIDTTFSQPNPLTIPTSVSRSKSLTFAEMRNSNIVKKELKDWYKKPEQIIQDLKTDKEKLKRSDTIDVLKGQQLKEPIKYSRISNSNSSSIRSKSAKVTPVQESVQILNMKDVPIDCVPNKIMLPVSEEEEEQVEKQKDYTEKQEYLGFSFKCVKIVLSVLSVLLVSCLIGLTTCIVLILIESENDYEWKLYGIVITASIAFAILVIIFIVIAYTKYKYDKFKEALDEQEANIDEDGKPIKAGGLSKIYKIVDKKSKKGAHREKNNSSATLPTINDLTPEPTLLDLNDHRNVHRVTVPVTPVPLVISPMPHVTLVSPIMSLPPEGNFVIQEPMHQVPLVMSTPMSLPSQMPIQMTIPQQMIGVPVAEMREKKPKRIIAIKRSTLNNLTSESDEKNKPEKVKVIKRTDRVPVVFKNLLRAFRKSSPPPAPAASNNSRYMSQSELIDRVQSPSSINVESNEPRITGLDDELNASIDMSTSSSTQRLHRNNSRFQNSTNKTNEFAVYKDSEDELTF